LKIVHKRNEGVNQFLSDSNLEDQLYNHIIGNEAIIQSNDSKYAYNSTYLLIQIRKHFKPVLADVEVVNVMQIVAKREVIEDGHSHRNRILFTHLIFRPCQLLEQVEEDVQIADGEEDCQELVILQ
jgi:hypothetical protein